MAAAMRTRGTVQSKEKTDKAEADKEWVPPKTIKHKRPYKKGCFLRIPQAMKKLWRKKCDLSAARDYKYAMTQALKASELVMVPWQWCVGGKLVVY